MCHHGVEGWRPSHDDVTRRGRFAYSIFYFFTKLEITKMVSAMLYFGYMAVAALIFFLVRSVTVGVTGCDHRYARV